MKSTTQAKTEEQKMKINEMKIADLEFGLNRRATEICKLALSLRPSPMTDDEEKKIQTKMSAAADHLRAAARLLRGASDQIGEIEESQRRGEAILVTIPASE
jgi:hypothetical protein